MKVSLESLVVTLQNILNLIQNFFTELGLLLPPWVTTVAAETLWILLGFAFAGYLVLRSRRRAKKDFKSRQMRGEVLGSVLIFDEGENGQILLKPRVVLQPRSIADAFVSQVIQDQIPSALKKCNETAHGSFVVMPDSDVHEAFMENVRALVSTLGKDGHLARAEGNPFKEEIYYVMATFSLEGKFRKIRIDLIHEDDLHRCVDIDFVERVTGRAEEGSHSDLAAICHYAASRRNSYDQKEADKYSLRTSISHRV